MRWRCLLLAARARHAPSISATRPGAEARLMSAYCSATRADAPGEMAPQRRDASAAAPPPRSSTRKPVFDVADYVSLKLDGT